MERLAQCVHACARVRVCMCVRACVYFLAKVRNQTNGRVGLCRNGWGLLSGELMIVRVKFKSVFPVLHNQLSQTCTPPQTHICWQHAPNLIIYPVCGCPPLQMHNIISLSIENESSAPGCCQSDSLMNRSIISSLHPIKAKWLNVSSIQ